MKTSALAVLKQYQEEFPNLFTFGVEVELGTKKVADGFYTSENTDDSPFNCNAYFRVKNGKISSIGQERGREGGWFWFKQALS